MCLHLKGAGGWLQNLADALHHRDSFCKDNYAKFPSHREEGCSMSSAEQSLLNNKKKYSKSFKIKKSVARQSTAHSYLVLVGPLFRNSVSLLVEMALFLFFSMLIPANS